MAARDDRKEGGVASECNAAVLSCGRSGGITWSETVRFKATRAGLTTLLNVKENKGKRKGKGSGAKGE